MLKKLFWNIYKLIKLSKFSTLIQNKRNKLFAFLSNKPHVISRIIYTLFWDLYRHLLAQSQQQKDLKKEWNMFEVNN